MPLKHEKSSTSPTDDQVVKKINKKKKYDETIIDGFTITAFKSWEDLQDEINDRISMSLQDEINDRISISNDQSSLNQETASETKYSIPNNDLGHSSSQVASTSSASSEDRNLIGQTSSYHSPSATVQTTDYRPLSESIHQHADKRFAGPQAGQASSMQRNMHQQQLPHHFSRHPQQQSKNRNLSPPAPAPPNHQQRRQDSTPPPQTDFIPNLYQQQSQSQFQQYAAAAAASDPSLLHIQYLSSLGLNPQSNLGYNPYNMPMPPPQPPHFGSFHPPHTNHMGPTSAFGPQPPPPPHSATTTNAFMRGLPAPYGSYIITDTTISRQTSIIPPPNHATALGLPPAFLPPALPAPAVPPSPSQPNLDNRFLPPSSGILSQTMHQHTSTYTPTATERSFMEFARNYANASHNLMNSHHHPTLSAAPPAIATAPPPGPPTSASTSSVAPAAAAAIGTPNLSNPFGSGFENWSRLAMEQQRAMSRLGGYFPNPMSTDRLTSFPGYPGASRPMSFPVSLYPPPF